MSDGSESDHRALIDQVRVVHKPKYPGAEKLVCEKCHVSYPCFIARLADALEQEQEQVHKTSLEMLANIGRVAQERDSWKRRAEFDSNYGAEKATALDDARARLSDLRMALAAAERRAAKLEQGAVYNTALEQEAFRLRAKNTAISRELEVARAAAECGAWHCSGQRRCELRRGHDGRHFTTSLGDKFGGWEDSASTDVPQLLEALDDAKRNAWTRAQAAYAERVEEVYAERNAYWVRLRRALGWVAELRSRAAQAESAILAYARWVRAAFPPELEQSDAEQRLLDLADTLEAST